MDEGEKRGGKRRKNEDESSKLGFDNLPREIVGEIFSRLPITSLIKFKFVCKSWKSLTLDSLPINIHLLSSLQRNPCLVLHCDFPLRDELRFIDPFCVSETTKVKKLKTPFESTMPEFEVVGSSNGLLCLTDSLFNESILVYNPFTRDYTELPKSIKYDEQEFVFGFGFHPGTRQYKVVKIIYYRNPRSRRLQYTQSDVQIFTLGDSSWRTLGKAPYQFVRRPSEAIVNGRLHFVTRQYAPTRKLMSFDLGDEQFREIPSPKSGDLRKLMYSLVNLNGCLSAILYGSSGKLEIWVMKKYGVRDSWIKEFKIRAYMPERLKQNVGERAVRVWKNGKKGKVVRVLCMMEDGMMLLEYRSRVLVLYDPIKGNFKDLEFDGMPNWFHTVVHVGGLNWIDTPLDVWIKQKED